MSPTTTATANTASTSPKTAKTKTQSDLNVSLEPHLVELLSPLLPLLPQHIHQGLVSVLPEASSTPPPLTGRTIPYSLLLAVSAWTRTPSGTLALQSLAPPGHLAAYTMASLLAGTRTSPERNFPKGSMVEVVDSEQQNQNDRSDRRAITALLNALLSIIGSGVAVWWAADMLHWKNEWKVLLAFFVAVVVAISEGALYLIWDSRRSKQKSTSRRLHKFSAPRIRKSSDAVTLESKRSSEPTVDSSQQSHGQESAIADSQPPSMTAPSAQSNIQIHATVDGLRERGARQR